MSNKVYSFSFWDRQEWLKPPDLLIIGGGIVGTSVALFYKKRFPGRDVLIVDKGFIPEGASTRNAGFACIGSISEHLADMKISGEETVLTRIERRWNGLQLLIETMGESSIGYRNTGGHEIFTNPDKFEMCRDKIDFFNRELKSRLNIGQVYQSKSFEGYSAIYNRVEGALNSGKLMRLMHQKAAAAGVRTWWNCEAEFVESALVRFSSGLELNPGKIVLATNGFTARLADAGITPARGYLFITKPIENLKWLGTFHHNEGYVYFRDVDNRLLLGGARHVDFSEETTDQFGINQNIRDWLIQFSNDILKLPEGWEMDQEWSGIMGFTEDKEPVISEIENNVWVAAGLSGMGIAIGLEIGRKTANLISK